MKPCRCLLRDKTDSIALADTISAWIDALPEERRAEPDVTERRLAVCTACGQLADGTCQRCGCYVEFRAAQRIMACPDGQW